MLRVEWAAAKSFSLDSQQGGKTWKPLPKLDLSKNRFNNAQSKLSGKLVVVVI